MDTSHITPSKINFNRRNSRGETILVTSLRRGKANSVIVSLIQSGCDVNICTKKGESPLHFAVSRRTTKVACELIKHGANLNAMDENRETPLHYAILDDKVEMVNMLLYYGANISISSSYNRTALMLAADMRLFQIFEILSRYYPESAWVTAQDQNLIAVRLPSLNLNCCWLINEDTFFLRFAMHCGIPNLFKLIWKRLDHSILLLGEKPFLVTYWNCKLPCFTTSDWLECLNLILTCPLAFEFAQHCKTYQDLYLPKLVRAFDDHAVQKRDRIAVLYSLFSLGIEVCCSDLDWIRLNYGYNEEFQACIYGGNYGGSTSDVDCNSPFSTFIFGLEEDGSVKKMFELFKHWPPTVCHYNRYFALYPDMKRELRESWRQRCRADMILDTFGKALMFYTTDIGRELSQMSEFPSLLELSRNATQVWIRKKFQGKISAPYIFHDIVKSLRLPKNLQDVIVFAQPIYG